MTFIINNSLTILLLTLLTFASTNTQAASSYRVEILVFRHLNPNAKQGEAWRDNIVMQDMQHAVELNSYDANNESYDTLSSSQFRLSSIADILNNSGVYQTMLHTGWTQPVYSKRNAKPVHVTSDNDTSQYQLDGTMTVSKGRYIHLQVNLALHKLLDTVLANEPSNSTKYHFNDNDQPNTPSSTSYSTTLKHSRRIKNKEIHYIDHAMFGLLVEIRPL